MKSKSQVRSQGPGFIAKVLWFVFATPTACWLLFGLTLWGIFTNDYIMLFLGIWFLTLAFIVYSRIRRASIQLHELYNNDPEVEEGGEHE